MDPLKNVIKKVISDLERTETKEANIVETWSKIVGKKAAERTRPVFLKKKKLVVNVSDSAWLYKLTLEKNALINTFNTRIKNPARKIRELQFRVGEV
ncbi:MAG: DUF721 domain-containing protein [Omnitrophica bacterium]|nr:DUF721 domain-containing protein [Candidatus Omnitrophota bacterium]